MTLEKYVTAMAMVAGIPFALLGMSLLLGDNVEHDGVWAGLTATSLATAAASAAWLIAKFVL